MAYGTKYHFTHSDRFGLPTLVNLKLNGYTGSDTLLSLGGISFEFGQSRTETVIRGSAARIGLWSLSQCQFSEFRDITDRKWQVEVLKGGLPYWYGWLTPEIFAEPFKHSLPYRVELVAVDGLGDLTNSDYSIATDVSTGSTRISFKSIIYQCLNAIKLDLPVCFSSKLRPSGTSGDPFVLAYYNNANFVDSKGVVLKCSDVIERFFMLGITVKQWRGKWYVVRTADLTAILHIYEYTSTGSFHEDYYLDLNEIIDDTSSGIFNNLPIGQTGQMSQEAAYKEALINEDYGLKTSMLDNGNFTAAGAWVADAGSLTFEKDKDVTYGYLSPKNISGITSGMTQTIAVEASTQAFVFSLKVAPFGYTWSSAAGYLPVKVTVRFRVKLTGVSGTYYLDKTKGWVTTITYIDIADLYCTHFGYEVNWYTVKITATGLPVDGALEVELCKLPYMVIPPSSELILTGIGYTEVLAYQIGTAYVSSQELKGINNPDYNYIPNEPTLTINDAPVVNNARLMYRNYISNSAGVPTTTWSVDSLTGTYPLVELYLRHAISLHHRPIKVITMTMRGTLEWPGTITDRDGVFYEIVSATLNDRECEWQIELREILSFVDLSPIVTVLATFSKASDSAAGSAAGVATINPTMVLAPPLPIAFTASMAPSILNYDTDYSNAYGQYPTIKLFTIDSDGNRLERSEKPKYLLVAGLIDSIVYDLAQIETGFILIS